MRSAVILPFPSMDKTKTKAERQATGLPNRIREHRKAQGMTLQQVADLTGFEVNNISRHERGDRVINVAHLQTYANALGGKPADYLLTQQGGLTADERALIDALRSGDDRLRGAVRAVINSLANITTVSGQAAENGASRDAA